MIWTGQKTPFLSWRTTINALSSTQLKPTHLERSNYETRECSRLHGEVLYIEGHSWKCEKYIRILFAASLSPILWQRSSENERHMISPRLPDTFEICTEDFEKYSKMASLRFNSTETADKLLKIIKSLHKRLKNVKERNTIKSRRITMFFKYSTVVNR